MEGTTPSASNQYSSDASGVDEFALEAAPQFRPVPATAPPLLALPPLSAVEVTVEDLVFLNVPLSWQEAAAIVVELASTTPPGTSWPDPAHAILTDTGEVVPALQVTVGGNPIRHAAALLERLLALTRLAPAELKVLVNKNVGDAPAHTSLESFVKSLSYFTRPNRLDDTGAVHGRASDLLQKRLLEREFDRVRHKSLHATARDGEDDEAPRYGFLRRMRPELLQGALVVLLCLMLASSGTALVSMAIGRGPIPQSASQPAPARRPGTAARESSTTQSAGSKGSDASNARPGARSALEPRVPAGRMASTATPAAEPRVPPSAPDLLPSVAPRSSASNAVQPPEAGRDRFWSVTLREVRPESTFPVPVPADGLAAFPRERSSQLFSPADKDVEPAALIRPQMPSPQGPSGPDQRDSVFDLVIDQNGRVEQVRLVSPGNRFNDRMLIAAAKAWQFLPAVKDGQPVRYKLQIRIAP